MTSEINLPFITSGADGPKHLLYKLTRAQFENMVSSYIEKSLSLVKQTLKEAGMEASQINEVVLVGGQTRMPKIIEEVKKLFGKEPNKEVNPDEVVAIGAAAQGGSMQGNMKDVLLLDVTPLSLGIETMGGVSTVLISKNTTGPTAKTQVFSTAADNQPSVEIHVLQGERPLAADNKTLGRFMLDGLPSAARGTPQIEVSFDIDANGILNVSAKDKATNKSQSIKIEGSSGLSKEEVEKMKKDAELHAVEDKKKQEIIEAKNLAEQVVYTSEKTLADAKEKVNADMKKDAEAKIVVLKESQKTDNIDDIKAKTKELSELMQKIGAELYKTNPQSGPASRPEGYPGSGEAKKEEPKADEGEFKETK